jgi:hypothetical protein
MKKYLWIFGVLLSIFGSIWLFNHVNPWLGIGLFILTIIFIYEKSTK